MAAQDFFRTYLPYARSVSEQTGIDPRLVLAQAALETGYGKSAPNYNFFGIKGRGQTQQTKEFRNGQWVTENAGFRSYSDPSGSFADYADLMMNSSRYEPVRAGRTLEEQIAAMASSGYATDPNYGAKLTKIASMIDYNSPELIGADAMRALGRDTGAIPVTQKRTEAPMGLLNMGQPSGQQAPAQAQGSGFWDKFAGGLLSDPDRRARLAMALEGMTLRPNEGVIAAAQSGIEDRKTKATLNKTIEWLRGQPNGEAYIRMIEAGASPAQVIQALMTPKESFQTVSGQQLIDMGMTGANPNAIYKINTATNEISQVGGTPAAIVNMGEKLSPFEETSQKFQAGMWGDMAKSAPVAQATLGQVEMLDTLLQQGGTGFSQGFSQFVFDTTGVDTRGSAAAAANALISQLVPAQRPAGSGTMSDADLALYRSSLPKLQASPEGNKIIVDGMKALAQYNLATSRIASQVLNGMLTPAQGDEAVIALGNPLAEVNARIQQLGSTGATGGNGAPVAGDVIDGYRFKGGNPNDMNNWEPI